MEPSRDPLQGDRFDIVQIEMRLCHRTVAEVWLAKWDRIPAKDMDQIERRVLKGNRRRQCRVL